MIRRGVAAVVFFRKDDSVRYLLMKRKKNWKGWEWLKGGRKKGESEKAVLKREIKEEIGIKRFKAKRTGQALSFKYQKEFVKDNKEYSGAKHRIYLVEVFSDKVKPDRVEHSGYRWASRKQALKLITWKDQRKVFSEATKSL